MNIIYLKDMIVTYVILTGYASMSYALYALLINHATLDMKSLMNYVAHDLVS